MGSAASVLVVCKLFRANADLACRKPRFRTSTANDFVDLSPRFEDNTVAVMKQRASLVTLIVTLPLIGTPGEADQDRIGFFERRIRPLLVENCQRCHGSERQRAGLRLDGLRAILAGGDSGPAVVPGRPEDSLLIQAVSYTRPDLQMPPKSKLGAGEIADLETWVRLGAPWPEEREPAGSGEGAGPEEEFDLEARRRAHWAWRPLSAAEPPPVVDEEWPRWPADHFLLAKLEERGLAPAPPASPGVLIRRLSFDLTGLPPSPEEVEAFLSDTSPGALERAADRLLASPRFGERWARHWLDLVRYAETFGHEFDYPIPNAYRYRDYVISAFNSDVPYDRFVLEHVAGDLLAEPRLDPAGGFDESAIATGFFWLGEQTHSPVDVRQHQADRIDNQIDVLTKTFLGLTVSCARCHDHKFDAISTADYYALFGVLESSRYSQLPLEPPEAASARIRRLEELDGRIRGLAGATWAAQAAPVAEYLLAAREVILGRPPQAVAEECRLEAARLERWVEALRDPETSRAEEPMAAWARLCGIESGSGKRRPFADEWRAIASQLASLQPKDAEEIVFKDFRLSGYEGWYTAGRAFGGGPAPPGTLFFDRGVEGKERLRLLEGGWAHSGAPSVRLEGALRSPTFPIERRYAHVRACGFEARVNVVVDGFNLIRDPIYGGLTRRINEPRPSWITFDLAMWKGRLAYMEVLDLGVPDPTHDAGGGWEAWVAVERVIFSDRGSPPAELPPAAPALLGDSAPESPEALAREYGRAAAEAALAWRDGKLEETARGRAQARLLDWLSRRGLLDATSGDDEALVSLLGERRNLEATIERPAWTPGMADGNGLDSPVFIRGSHKNPGAPVPRRFLEALGAGELAGAGSGRLDLARRLVDPAATPLVPRVIVNRIWRQLFGEGLVATPDNFGAQGSLPTHPELLDWLAAEFVEDGWSIKKLVRRLVGTSAYRMSSLSSAAARELDPSNSLFHGMRLRRLDAEALRDGILAVSGRLDGRLFGPSVPVHLTPFMEGRGRPGKSGPLDGAGRRSIYLEVRRNFLAPMMLAFDAPIPFSTMGRRGGSNVPAQALILMNDPFVREQSELWARRLLAGPASTPAERVAEMYLAAFGRRPEPEETAAAEEFLREQAPAYGDSAADLDARAWADLAHVLFNLKEFLYIP
jgi:hypothetical protein